MDKNDEIKKIEQELVQAQFSQVMKDVKREKYLKKATQIYEKRKTAAAMKLDRDAFLQGKNFIYHAAYMSLYHLPKVPIGIYSVLNVLLGFIFLAGCLSLCVCNWGDLAYFLIGLSAIVCFYQQFQLGVYTDNMEEVAELKETRFFLTGCYFIALVMCSLNGYWQGAIAGLVLWCISKIIIPNSLMAQVRMRR